MLGVTIPLEYTDHVIGRTIHICSTKYDGSPHWEFDSWFVLEEGSLVVTQDFPGQVMQTWNGPWTNPYHIRNYFWSDRWYNVMRFERFPGGSLEEWYCNISTPTRFDAENLCWVDLDLDVRVSPTGQPRVLDEDEFLENSRRMGYPPEVVEQARHAVVELLAMVRGSRFPFERP